MKIIFRKYVKDDLGANTENYTDRQVEARRDQSFIKTVQNQFGQFGSQTLSSRKIFFDIDPKIEDGEKVVHGNKEFELISIYAAKDDDGVLHHTEVLI
jgi:hypothetical protein